MSLAQDSGVITAGSNIQTEFRKMEDELRLDSTERKTIWNYVIAYSQRNNPDSHYNLQQAENNARTVLNEHINAGKSYLYDDGTSIYDRYIEDQKSLQDSIDSSIDQQKKFEDALNLMNSAGDVELNALYAQTRMEEEHAKEQEKLLTHILGAVDKTGTIDVQKKLNDIEMEHRQTMETLVQRGEQAVEARRNELSRETDQMRENMQTGQDLNIHRLENQMQREQAFNEKQFNDMQRQSTMNADLIKTWSSAREKQRSTDTSFSISMLTAKDGNEWTKAVLRRNAESYFNQQEAVLEERQRREREAFEARGNYTEEEKAQLEAKQESERGELSAAKQMSDAIRESINGVGGLRSLVTEGTGQKSDLEGTWERIQAAAFGHIIDPTADAITMLNKTQQLQHAGLMQVLLQQLPLIAANTGRMNPEALARMMKANSSTTINNYNNRTGLV